MEKILNYINGEYQEPQSGKFIDNIEPATGKVYSLIPDSDKRDVDMAVSAAEKAFPKWSGMNTAKRSEILRRLAQLIDENLEALAAAESKDNGKPVSLAKAVDIPRASSNIDFFATAIVHFSSESHQMSSGAFNYTTRKPIGIVGCISPWNLPLYLFTWKIAPALAAGNCVIAKPSEITPYTAYLLCRLCDLAGMPKGVFNVIHGLGPKVGDAIVRDPSIKAISFTGGTKTGAAIASIAAPMFKKLSLELGGKNPNIIFADCDFDEMLATTMRSSFANQGQICLCGSRIFVERSIYDRFVNAFVEKTKKMDVGDPSLDETKMGAMVSEGHLKKVLEHIEIAKAEGGEILAGGNRIKMKGVFSDGYYLEPTIIAGLPQACRTNREEIFGPVVTVMPFDTEVEVLAMANDTEYGLSATLWTNDLIRAHRIADQLESGIVWINCWLVRDLRTPFGGTKNSGVGREGGWEALRFFTEPKNICVQL